MRGSTSRPCRLSSRATRTPRASPYAGACARSSTRSGSTGCSPSATWRSWRDDCTAAAEPLASAGTRTGSTEAVAMSGPGPHGFNLSTVFATVAAAVPDQEVLVWRERRLTYTEMDARATSVARLLAAHGLGCHVERERLAGHESGQDHVGLYLHNGNEYL